MNEPRHVACGKPDIAIVRMRDNVTVASAETKDIGKPDLEGRGRNQEQFSKMLAYLPSYVDKKIQPITSATKLSSLMAQKSQLMYNIIKEIMAESDGNDAAGLLKKTYKDLKDGLILNLDEEDFAKIYSQTVAYGMFAARLHDKSTNDFSRSEAAELIPRSNPLLRGIFNDLSGRQRYGISTSEATKWPRNG